MLQANPNLTIDQISTILRETAHWQTSYETDQNPITGQMCGPRPNYCYGWGLLQVDAAVVRALELGSATPTPTPLPCGGDLNNYTYTEGTGSIVPGTGEPVNSCDDCSTTIALPSGFSFRLYDQIFAGPTAVTVSSNGSLYFDNGDAGPPPSATECLPGIANAFTYAIFPHWAELRTDGTFGGHALGVYTSTSGSPPNRIFNIEWRACYKDKKTGLCTAYVNFEIRLHESESGNEAQPVRQGTGQAEAVDSAYASEFEVIFGPENANGPASIMGVLRDQTTFTAYACHQSISPNLRLTFTMLRPCPTPTPQPTHTYTPTPIPPPTSTYTPCPYPNCGTFYDVPTNNTFYPYISCLHCRNVVSGYPCGGPGEPCLDCTYAPYFRPGAYVTRGQLSKIVSNAAGFTEDPGGQIFQDVPPGPDPPRHTFYDWINRIARRGIVGGYPCGGAEGEPCVPPDNRPYFRPAANALRGHVAKMVSNAAGYLEIAYLLAVPGHHTRQHILHLGREAGITRHHGWLPVWLDTTRAMHRARQSPLLPPL